ncbi:12482_t:CDS:1 [Ambispora gerdemannii]|uniref:12482_t:CDS:1 n=1 Tax=Ambispora gerdemannii TaxID=144530 RepID=A0A9N9DST4_9GLOM|nr:12482_t:CDS:1 [Ambispora gerdemannii]
MASVINELCIKNIFEYVLLFDEEGLPLLHKNDLFCCALVNRHWCIHAVPLLWRTPFPIWPLKGASFISTLLKCFENDDNREQNQYIDTRKLYWFMRTLFPVSIFKGASTLLKHFETDDYRVQRRPAFRYNLMIKQLDLSCLGDLIHGCLKNKHKIHNSHKLDESGDTLLWDTYKLLCHKLINTTENSFFELVHENEEAILSDKLNIFKIPNAKESLGNLRKLSIYRSESRVLDSASKICPNLSSIQISCKFWDCFDEYLELHKSLSLLKLFKNLKCLDIYCGELLAQNYGDNLLMELGKKLPKSLEILGAYGDLKFSVESLEKFLHGAKQIKFKSLDFRYSKCISDAHLEIILRAVGDSNFNISIKELFVYCGWAITREQVRKLQDEGIIMCLFN